MGVLLKEATETIKAHPYSFMYQGEVQRAFRALQKDINERTEDTDTLVISIPAEKIANPEKLHQLSLPVTAGEHSDGTKIINFDWFTLPEKRTGFANAASDFILTLVNGLNDLPDATSPSADEVKALKQKHTSGTKLRIVKMADDYGLPEETIATVNFVDDIGQIHVKESGVAIIPGIDEFEVVQ